MSRLYTFLTGCSVLNEHYFTSLSKWIREQGGEGIHFRNSSLYSFLGWPDSTKCIGVDHIGRESWVREEAGYRTDAKEKTPPKNEGWLRSHRVVSPHRKFLHRIESDCCCCCCCCCLSICLFSSMWFFSVFPIVCLLVAVCVYCFVDLLCFSVVTTLCLFRWLLSVHPSAF